MSYKTDLYSVNNTHDVYLAERATTPDPIAEDPDEFLFKGLGGTSRLVEEETFLEQGESICPEVLLQNWTLQTYQED